MQSRIRESFDHQGLMAHLGVTATVYAHVRLRLQRDAIDLLGSALRIPTVLDYGDEPPLSGAAVR
ncbi:hypothetical protein [Streptomyces lydicus]|uniref:hypothetical protein n=1 Tax=Streptomyces lydicus TaxID=47763 RepID=UPI00286FB4C3|nr:hypothetical protein [Streptomyces lydicus]